MTAFLRPFLPYLLSACAALMLASFAAVWFMADELDDTKDKLALTQLALQGQEVLDGIRSDLRDWDSQNALAMSALRDDVSDLFNRPPRKPDYVIAPTPDCPSTELRPVGLHDIASAGDTLLLRTGAYPPLGEAGYDARDSPDIDRGDSGTGDRDAPERVPADGPETD